MRVSGRQALELALASRPAARLTRPAPRAVGRSDFFQLPPVGGEAASRSINQPGPDEGAARADGTPFGSFLEQCMVDANMHYTNPFLPYGFRETKGKLVLHSLAWQEAGFTMCKLQRCFRTDSELLLAGCSAMREGKDDGPEIQDLVRATSRPLPLRNGVVPTTLFSTKTEVKRLNREELSRLDAATEQVYTADDQAVPDSSLKEERGRKWAQEELMRDIMFTKEDECPAVDSMWRSAAWEQLSSPSQWRQDCRWLWAVTRQRSLGAAGASQM